MAYCGGIMLMPYTMLIEKIRTVYIETRNLQKFKKLINNFRKLSLTL